MQGVTAEYGPARAQKNQTGKWYPQIPVDHTTLQINQRVVNTTLIPVKVRRRGGRDHGRRRQVGRRLAREAAQVVHHPLEVLAVCEALVEQRSTDAEAEDGELHRVAPVDGPFYN